MNRLKISTRLYLLMAISSMLLMLLGAVGMYGSASANAGLKSVYEDRTVPLKHLAEINYLINRDRVLLLEMLATPMPPMSVAAKGKRQELGRNIEQITATWKAYRASAMTSEEGAVAAEFEQIATAYLREGLYAASQALGKDEDEQARRIHEEKVVPLAPRVQEAVDRLMTLQTSVARQEYESAQARYELLRAVEIGAVLLGVAIALALGLALTRALTRSLAMASRMAQAVAQGDLRTDLAIEGDDEVAALLRTLVEMQRNLAAIVTRVREGADSVSTASGEIAQGNQDLSARTESQASALQQTASSMEQLGATVRQNAENAQQADRVAKQSADMATRGGEVVGAVVETMQGISESSRRIADIINVIDGIAFQTNILALNAAVEAARAGEQGRGFAVVASEVRSLAGRSAEAAKQIKQLIQDSVERVEQGGALVQRAGSTMDEVVSGVARVNSLMGAISSASSEQSAGVTQIGEAVGQLDRVTQQNAALVEQMAAAAASLQNQAGALVEAVAVFRLRD